MLVFSRRIFLCFTRHFPIQKRNICSDAFAVLLSWAGLGLALLEEEQVAAAAQESPRGSAPPQDEGETRRRPVTLCSGSDEHAEAARPV